MILRLLSFLDFVTAVVVILAHVWGLPWIILLYTASYLLIKSAIFYSTWVSWVDAVCGVWIILMGLGLSTSLSWVVVAWLCYKALLGVIF